MMSLTQEVSIHTVPCELPLEQGPVEVGIRYAVNDPKAKALVVTGFTETYIGEVASDLARRGYSAKVCALENPADVEVTPAVIEAMIIHGLPAVMRAASVVDLVGHSIGFAKSAFLASLDPDLCRQVVGVGPFGLNNTLRPNEILKRMRASGQLDPSLVSLDFAQLYDEILVGSAFIRSQDSVAKARWLAKAGKLPLLLFGKYDHVSPAEEWRSLLGPNLPTEIIEVEGGHDALNTSVGMDQLAYAFSVVYS